MDQQPVRPPKPRDPIYRMYIDESGDHAYRKLDRPGHCYLALLGVWFSRKDDYPVFADGLTKITRDHFGATPDEPVILHRKELVNYEGPFGVLSDHGRRNRFNNDLLALIHDSPFTMVCVIINKKKHQEQYIYPFHPYHYSVSAMVERYSRWLSERGTEGDVCAESRGQKEDDDLTSKFRDMWNYGDGFLKKDMIQRTITSSRIKLHPKEKNIAGLQLADLLAHPLKVEALVERGLMIDPGATFGRDMAAVAAPKYRRLGSRIDGIGRVWL